MLIYVEVGFYEYYILLNMFVTRVIAHVDGVLTLDPAE